MVVEILRFLVKEDKRRLHKIIKFQLFSDMKPFHGKLKGRKNPVTRASLSRTYIDAHLVRPCDMPFHTLGPKYFLGPKNPLINYMLLAADAVNPWLGQ
jgi:hypothetical protein